MSEAASPSSLQPEIERIIRMAGDFARKEFKQFTSQHIEYKGRRDLFSYVDVETEKLIKTDLAPLIPGAGFINEEGDDQESKNEYTWIIDPIDGTTNFIHGVPCFSICIALQHVEEIVLGFVYDVMADELFQAVKGGGATLNGETIHVSETVDLKDGLLATGFPYDASPWLESFLRLLLKVMQNSHGLRRFGSAAIDLAYVASGRLEGFFEFGLNPWDVAAGALIVEEAGGKVTDIFGGNNYIYGRQMIATNKHVHKEILDILQEELENIRHFPKHRIDP